MLWITRCLPALAAACLLSGCAVEASLSAVATPKPLKTPPAAGAAEVWVGSAGRSDGVLRISGDAAELISLPLDDGQEASNLVVDAAAGLALYVTWQGEEQAGVALWPLDEPTARLLVPAQPGAPVIDLFYAGGQVVIVRRLGDVQPDGRVDWRVELLPITGEGGTRLFDSQTLPGLMPPRPFGWPTDGPLLLAATAPNGSSQGVYTLEPARGSSAVLLPPNAEEVLVAPALSAAGDALAYLSFDPALVPPAFEGRVPTNLIRIYDLQSLQRTTITPPAGQAIYGLAWLPDGRLLYEEAALDAARVGMPQITWVVVEASSGEEVQRFSLEIGQERAFSYAALGSGLALTATAPEGTWWLHVIDDLAAPTFTRRLSLAPIAREDGAPVVLDVREAGP